MKQRVNSTSAAHWLVLACAVVAISGTAHAATEHADAFWLVPVSAREMSLGQATLAETDDATAFHWNPAGIGHVRSFDATASYTSMMGGLASHQLLAAAMPVGDKLALGAAWVRVGVDDIPVLPSLEDYLSADERNRYAVQYGNDPMGYFTYSQNAFVISLARSAKVDFDMGWEYLTLPLEVPVGISAKYLTVSAGDSASASGIGFDIGAQLAFDANRALDTRTLGRVSLGLALANVGGMKMTWDTPRDADDPKYSDEMKMMVAWGAAYRQPIPSLNSSLTFLTARAVGGTAWGFEYWYRDMIALRAGRDMLDSTDWSLGTGISWLGFGFDYALQWHPLGVTHRVSLQYHL